MSVPRSHFGRPCRLFFLSHFDSIEAFPGFLLHCREPPELVWFQSGPKLSLIQHFFCVSSVTTLTVLSKANNPANPRHCANKLTIDTSPSDNRQEIPAAGLPSGESPLGQSSGCSVGSPQVTSPFFYSRRQIPGDSNGSDGITLSPFSPPAALKE